MGDAPGESRTSKDFSDRVLLFLLTQILTAGLALFNGFLLARLIGPSAKGEYYLLTFLPTVLMAVCQLGLPQAFTYFSARRATRGLITQAFVLTALVAFPVMLITAVLLPVLQATFLHGLPTVAILIPLSALPFLLNANFTTGIVVGRQAAIGMAVVYISTYLSATVLIVLLVGMLDLGLPGALVIFVATAVITAAGFLAYAVRTTRNLPAATSPSYRGLLRFGLPSYPGSLGQFFAVRADIFILAWLLAEPAAPIGYYSLAVALAEVLDVFPHAVSTFFFPHVASANREDSDRQVAMVTRVTLLLTGVVALALVPIAAIGIGLFLPAFEPSLPALYVLLPAVAAFGVTHVLAGYVSGLGRPGLTSVVGIGAFTANIVLNIVLIPRLGIVGASTASLISYGLSSIVYSLLAARLTRQKPLDFWIPRGADVRFVVSTIIALVRRIIGLAKRGRFRPGV
jgi:O-antigen/teichoic acid export membrane protein